jgi:glycine/D-amino acid oxidase-like deaminating enzyme
MPHALTELSLAEVTRPASEPAREIRADVCVVGAGIAGLSAAIESARLHRDVVLVDSLPLIGGQMVHSLIGLFCGVFGNGPEYRQLTHGIFDDIFRDLGPSGDLHFQPGHTKTVYYNEVALGTLARAHDQEPRRPDDPRHGPAPGGRRRRPRHRDRARVPLRQRHDRGGWLRRRQRRRRPDLAGRAAMLGP